MRLIFIGPPGAGKGTQAKIISERLNLKHISTGDLLRENLQNKTALGLKAKEYMDKGELVPDNLVIEIVKEVIKTNKNFIMDGFPRTINQAIAFDEMLKNLSLSIDKVFYFSIGEEEVIKRISGRRVCPKCGAVYHVIYKKPKNDEMCDFDGEKLIQRDDDKEEVVRNRFKVYVTQTEPVLNYYKEKSLLIEIDASLAPEKVTNIIIEALR